MDYIKKGKKKKKRAANLGFKGQGRFTGEAEIENEYKWQQTALSQNKVQGVYQAVFAACANTGA